MSVAEEAVSPFADAIELLRGHSAAILTGAGLSTDSGIPDYRGPHSPKHTPMTIAEFRSGPASRQRYWARSHIGWDRMRHAEPNGGHDAIAEMQAAAVASIIITQNVDGLHQKAGSNPVIDLHGRLDTVVCLDCGRRSPRLELHRRLTELNPGFSAAKPAAAGSAAGLRDAPTLDADPNITPTYDVSRGEAAARTPANLRPDGDAEVANTSEFVVANCLVCGGVLKPDVVFFGENVPPDKVRAAYAAVDEAGALLVAGSSLTVMSGLRFVKRAATRGIPIVILNHGATRGDGLATIKLDAGCTDTLRTLAAALA